jgi:hypothetical protein
VTVEVRTAPYWQDGKERERLPKKPQKLASDRLARCVATQANLPFVIFSGSLIRQLIRQRGDAPLIVATQKFPWQPRSTLRNGWPFFMSWFSSLGSETLHKHAAENGRGGPDQIEVYVVFKGVALLIIPHGHGEVEVRKLSAGSVGIVFPNTYHFIKWVKPGYGLVFRTPNYGPDTPDGKVTWSDGDCC